jgi:hypothetical protein
MLGWIRKKLELPTFALFSLSYLFPTDFLQLNQYLRMVGGEATKIADHLHCITKMLDTKARRDHQQQYQDLSHSKKMKGFLTFFGRWTFIFTHLGQDREQQKRHHQFERAPHKILILISGAISHDLLRKPIHACRTIRDNKKATILIASHIIIRSSIGTNYSDENILRNAPIEGIRASSFHWTTYQSKLPNDATQSSIEQLIGSCSTSY